MCLGRRRNDKIDRDRCDHDRRSGTNGLTPGDKVTAPTRTLQRGLQVLEALAGEADDDGLSVSEIAAIVDLDKATANRLVRTLCQSGYAYQDPKTRQYKLTGKLLALGSSHRENLDLPGRAAPFLARLRGETEETVHLGVRELDRVVYIAKLDSQLPVQIASAIGQTMPMHTTALGKAILSAMPDDQRDALLEQLDLTPRTENSLRSVADLRADIERSRRRGYSVDDRENEDSITCVGAPIVNGLGEVLGAISVSGPTFRMKDQIEAIGEKCAKAAADIGATL